MMTTSVQWQVKRILVAIDTVSHGAPAVETAAALAAGFNAPLHGLFIENANLLRLAALPFAREIGFSSAAERPLEWQVMARFFRRESALAERLLSEAAERLQVPWTFQTTRGLPVATPFELAQATDLLVLGKSRPARHGPVLALFDRSPAAPRALGVAALLAVNSASPLVILLPQEDTARLQTQAITLLSGSACDSRFQPLPQNRLAGIANATARLKAAAMVLPGDPASLGGAEIHALLEKMDCPLILAA